MTRLLLFTCFFLHIVICFAQQDSIIYYNAYWEITDSTHAEYYRVLNKKNNLYDVKDHYLDGQLQMTGTYSSLKPDIEEGYFIWYYQNGQKHIEGNFIHGERQGIWTFWFPDGLKKEEVKFFPSHHDYFSVKWRSKIVKASYRFFDRALSKIKRKNYDAALELLDDAIKINPYFAEALFEKGKIECMRDNKEKCCEHLSKAKEYGYLDNEKVNKAIEEHCH